MKLITFGKLNKKFLLLASIYIALNLFLNISSIFLQKLIDKENKILRNIPIMLIIIHGSLVVFVFFECWLRKTTSNRFREINNNENNLITSRYFDRTQKKANLKKFLVLVLIIILDYIYDAGIMYYQLKYEKHSELVFGEVSKFLDVFFLLCIFRCFHKILFYRHQYISLLLITIMGLGRFFIPLSYDDDYLKNMINNVDYLSFIFIIIFPFIDSIGIYFLQKYMIYNYYSPFYICFLIGLIFLVISIIFLFALNNHCGDFCQYLSYNDLKFPGIGEIFLLIFYSICYSFRHFMNLWIINSFTVFHLILIVTFGEVVNNIFELISDFDYRNLILIIIAYFFEILGVLFFIETIELNFCMMNVNIRKNIMFRAGNEVDSIYKLENEEESEETDHDLQEASDKIDTTVYE